MFLIESSYIQSGKHPRLSHGPRIIVPCSVASQYPDAALIWLAIATGETQACADAAAEHSRSLEDQAIAQRTETEAALATSAAQLEGEREAAAATLAATAANFQARIEALGEEVKASQVPLPQGF